ncbi:MAG TPA: ureidoglycolate lyase [Firmicutes bacterium]|nr:ureidoglycolate lyase [Bacillota bacterium]
MDISLKLKKVTDPSFAEYGQVVIPRAGTPDSSGPDHNWWDALAVVGLGDASFGVVEAINTGEYRQGSLEQHKHTKEIVIPVEKDVFLVVAKPDAFEGAPDASKFAAFYAPAGAVVILNEGVWHKAPMTLSDRAACLVLYKAGTGANDKVVLDMAEQGLEIRVAAL